MLHGTYNQYSSDFMDYTFLYEEEYNMLAVCLLAGVDYLASTVFYILTLKMGQHFVEVGKPQQKHRFVWLTFFLQKNSICMEP